MHFFVGSGREVIAQAARATGLDGAAVLEAITSKLLVNKGVDWTNPILGEYLGLFPDSMATFVLGWDEPTREFAAHGAMFQSARHPAVGLVAHIRTLEAFKGRGLGTQVVERVVQAGFDRGAEVIVLATDDKLLRVEQGEKAANRLYSRIGFTILAEKRLADTVDWLMVIDRPSFDALQQVKQNDGRLPDSAPEAVEQRQRALVRSVRTRLASPGDDARIEPAANGDLAALFLLLNACPPDDFRLKLSAWDVHHGPELERAFVMSVRPAMGDQDRLEEASLVLRERGGCVAAVCAARQETPFTRNTFRIDLYCLPEVLRENNRAIKELVRQTLRRIGSSPGAPRPGRLAFWGLDDAKVELFQSLGFGPTGNTMSFFHGGEAGAMAAREYLCRLGEP